VERLPQVEILQENKKNPTFFWQQSGDKYKYKLTGRFDQKSGHYQLKVNPILSLLSTLRNSCDFKAEHKDAFCIMGITLEDLYEEDPDLFVAGMAHGGSKVAVFSFTRYAPGVLQSMSDEHWWKWGSQSSKAKANTKTKKRKRENEDDENTGIWLKRACRLLVHELGHLYGVGHCTFFSCLMNGSGHLSEDFSQPLHLCPVDLKKIMFRLKMDPIRHYRSLVNFYGKHETTFADEIAQIKNILSNVEKKTKN